MLSAGVDDERNDSNRPESRGCNPPHQAEGAGEQTEQRGGCGSNARTAAGNVESTAAEETVDNESLNSESATMSPEERAAKAGKLTPGDILTVFFSATVQHVGQVPSPRPAPPCDGQGSPAPLCSPASKTESTVCGWNARHVVEIRFVPAASTTTAREGGYHQAQMMWDDGSREPLFVKLSGLDALAWARLEGSSCLLTRLGVKNIHHVFRSSASFDVTAADFDDSLKRSPPSTFALLVEKTPSFSVG